MIAQVVAETTADAALEVGRSGAQITEASGGLHQGQACHLDQVITIEQGAAAAMQPPGEGIGKGKEAANDGIPLLAGEGWSHGRHAGQPRKTPGEGSDRSGSACAIPSGADGLERGMGRQRRAGEHPGIQALVAAAGDNLLTRAWNDLVTGAVIQPVERWVGGAALESRDTQMRLARAVAADLASHGGVLSAPMTALLREHVDGQVDVERLNRASAVMDAAGLNTEERAVQINTLLAGGAYHPGLVERGDVDERRTSALRQAVLAGQPRRASTEAGEVMRQYGVGSPLAAYGAMAGVVAGVVAAADALNRSRPGNRPSEEPPIDAAIA